jgi:hypothetical protein
MRSKLCFGDRVAVLNVRFFRTEGVCFNKINSPPQVPPPPPSPLHQCLRFHLAVRDLPGFEVDLRVVCQICLLVGRICSQVVAPTSSTWSCLPPPPLLCSLRFGWPRLPPSSSTSDGALTNSPSPGFRFGVHPTTSSDGNPHILRSPGVLLKGSVDPSTTVALHGLPCYPPVSSPLYASL